MKLSLNNTSILYILAFLTLGIFLVISKIDKPLQNSQAPNGIVSFELAKNINKSHDIVSSWDSQTKLYAAFSLGIDYLFLLSYSLFFALIIFKIASALKTKYKLLAMLGIFLAWAQFLAALFDALENFFLSQLLFGSTRLWFSGYAYVLASTKFWLILAGLVYILLGLLLLLNIRFKNSSTSSL